METELKMDRRLALCPACRGRGFFDRERVTDYRRNDRETARTPCHLCGGSGRVLEERRLLRWSPADRVTVPAVRIGPKG